MIFFYFLLQTFQLQELIKLHTLGQAVKGINISDVRRLFFGVPNKEEQLKIANRLSTHQSEIEKSESYLSKLRSLKTALMQDLLTGMKRVTDLLNVEVVG